MSKSFAALIVVMLGAKAGDVKHNFEIRIRKSKGVNKCPTDSGNWDNSRNQANSYPVHPRQDYQRNPLVSLSRNELLGGRRAVRPKVLMVSSFIGGSGP